MNSSSRGESSLNVDSAALIACSGAATAAVEQVFFFFESWYRQWCISWEAPRLSAFCIDSKYRSLVTPANIRGGNSSERVLRQWFGPKTHFKLKSILCVCHQNLTTTAYTVLLKAQMWLWWITRTHIYDQGWNNTDLSLRQGRDTSTSLVCWQKTPRRSQVPVNFGDVYELKAPHCY